jgi:hypothetical protein
MYGGPEVVEFLAAHNRLLSREALTSADIALVLSIFDDIMADRDPRRRFLRPRRGPVPDDFRDFWIAVDVEQRVAARRRARGGVATAREETARAWGIGTRRAKDDTIKRVLARKRDVRQWFNNLAPAEAERVRQRCAAVRQEYLIERQLARRVKPR